MQNSQEFTLNLMQELSTHMQSNDKIRIHKGLSIQANSFCQKQELSKRTNGGVLKRKEEVVTYLIKELSGEKIKEE